MINKDGKYATVNAEGKVTGWVNNETDGSTLTSDGNGVFKVIGLDDAVYKLKETKAPDGYNLLPAPIDFTIKAETSNNQNWTGTADEI